MALAEIAPSGAKSLLICSTGGHLSELVRIEERIGINPESVWLTFDTAQSRQMLEGRRVVHLPYIGPRDLKGTLAAAPLIRSLVKAEKFDAAISTGAAIATTALPLAALSRVPATYVESVCRLHGPSATGRILQCVPGIALRTPHPRWATGRWGRTESILSDFRSEDAPDRHAPRKVFVTLGTIRGYRFDSLIDAMLRSGYANEHTVWQLGDTPRADTLPGTVHDYMSPTEFAHAAKEADVVVAHAGVGTLLELLGMGIYPIQAIRRAARGEHVDDHQIEIADLVNSSGIGLAVEGPDLSAAAIEHAARRRIVDGLHVQPVPA